MIQLIYCRVFAEELFNGEYISLVDALGTKHKAFNGVNYPFVTSPLFTSVNIGGLWFQYQVYAIVCSIWFNCLKDELMSLRVHWTVSLWAFLYIHVCPNLIFVAICSWFRITFFLGNLCRVFNAARTKSPITIKTQISRQLRAANKVVGNFKYKKSS